MSKYEELNEHWEAQINALIDGELSEAEVAALRGEAERNQVLAQAIIDAHALQASIDELQVERAPSSLRSKLRKIPATETASSARWFGLPRWVPAGALAALPVMVLAMIMMTRTPPEQPEYSAEEVLQAREDLITAFAYLDRIGSRAGRHIEEQLAEELRGGVKDNVAKYMPFTHQTEEEETS